ncbi:hypothetical protein ACFSX9_14015 [Flavobacterium ardleyense]|uniref:Uncharacterized protein n=1 Tax=Flavobacterium ardleyense TaxID=2038737 RepID=A0ABW5ZBH3_9FLAO
MIDDFRSKVEDGSRDLYLISNDTLLLEAYNSYRKKLEYTKAIIKKDTLFITNIKSIGNEIPYVFMKL